MPQRKLHIRLDPPLAGVNKRTGFQQRPPYTAHAITDMWPVDVDSGRAVLATRPELTVVTSPDETVNCLARVNGVRSDGPKQSMIAVSDEDGRIYWWDETVWRLATGAQAASGDTGRAVFAVPFLMQAFIFKENAKPIVFDYPTATAVTLVEHAGECPTGCTAGFVWQGGLWMFGDPDNPHVLYGARTGNAYDWDFSADIEDTGGAFFSGGEDEGLLRGPITAGFNHTSDTAIISTLEGMFAMRGHPRRGGVFEDISNTYILGQGAHTKTPDDTVFAMTTRGLVMIDTAGRILPVSDRAIPDDLVGLAYNIDDPTISVCYDSWRNCVHITDRKAGATQSWSFFIDTQAFVKNALSNYPYCMLEFPAFITDDTSGVLFGRS